MRALIRKEWLENRALILGFLVIAPALSFALKQWVVGWPRTFPEHTVSYFAPAMLALFLVGLAADLVAADSASGRTGFLAALPARPASLWAAKILFLFGAATLYLGYLLATEAAILALGGKPAGELLAPDAWEAKALLVPAVLGAATLFFSTLLDRGFAAAFAALAASVGLLFLLSLAGLPAWHTERAFTLFDPARPREQAALLAFAIAGAGFLAGSLLAFTRGRIHLGSRLRRAVLATAGFLVVVSPPAAWAAHAHHRHWVPRPSDENLWVGLAGVSPDGAWAVVELSRRELKGPLGLHGRPKALWAVRLDGSRTVRVEGGTEIWGRDLFREGPGKVVVRRPEPVPGDKRGEFVWLRVVFDLEAGRIARTRAEPAPTGSEWWPHTARNGWAEVVCRSFSDRNFGVRPAEGGEVVPLPFFPAVLPSGPDGAALAVEVERVDGKAVTSVVRMPLDGSEPAAVAKGEHGGWSRASSGEVALVRIGGRALLLRDGAATPVEVPAELPIAGGLWSDDGRFLLVRGAADAPVSRIEVREDGVALDSIELPRLPGTLAWTDGARVLVNDWTGGTLTLVAADGTVRNLIPGGDR